MLIKFILIFSSLLISNENNHHWCSLNHSNTRNFERMEYTFPESIDSEHFRVHFTSQPADSFFWNESWQTHQSNINYATTLINELEYAYSIYENTGWHMPPPDCDNSISDINNPNNCINYGGNELYDVYIGLVQGPAAAVVPENPLINSIYEGGLSSFMLFGNGLGWYGSSDDIAYFNYYIIAHELHHSIQFSYGSYITGQPGNYVYHSWMLEQTATYMENFIYPDAMHLRLMLGNCNIDNPLTKPEIGIYQSYPGALWQHFLVNFLDDNELIRNLWESYGTKINNQEDPITFFNIFDEKIIESSNQNYSLSDLYKEYAIWRYFTGTRAIPNQYFNQANLYCNSKVLNMPIENLELQAELGGNHYINIPNEDILVILDSPQDKIYPGLLLGLGIDGDLFLSDLEFNNGTNIVGVDEDFDGSHILIILSGYSGNELDFDTASFDVNYMNYTLGDLDSDGTINIVDVILAINFILNDTYNYLVDINEDGLNNILDIVQIIEIILE